MKLRILLYWVSLAVPLPIHLYGTLGSTFTVAVGAFNTKVAIASDGRFVVGYEDSSTFAPFFQPFDVAGSAAGSPISPRSTNEANEEDALRGVEIAANGDFVVIWIRYVSGTFVGQLFGRRFNADGTPKAGEFQISSDSSFSRFNVAHIAVAPDGFFVCAWQGGSNGSRVVFQRHNASGVAQGSNTEVTTGDSDSQSRPNVAIDGNGNFVVTWQVFGTTNDLNARCFNADGTPKSAAFLVEASPNGDSFAGDAHIAMNNSGRFAIFYQACDFVSGICDGKVKIYLPDCTLVTGPLTLFPGAVTGAVFKGAMDGAGNLNAIRGDFNFFDELLSTDLTLDFLDPLGVAMASSIPVFETPPGHYSGTACIAMNEDGTYVIIFEDQGTMKGRRCVVADPPDLSISATDADKPEGDSGTTPFTFTVTRSGDTSGTTMVDFAVTGTGDDPVNAADFGGTLPSGMITFNDGETSKPVTVDVSGDTINEAIETFDVGLSNPSGGATISNGAAPGTIQNDEVPTNITVNTLSDTVDPNDNVNSLREAIIQANINGPGVQTDIMLPAGTLTLTMMGAGEDAGLTGDLDLTGNVKVTGQGAATTLIDGTGLGDRGFHVQSDGTLTVSNIGSSGMDGVGPGGAILNDGGDVTIQNSTISNNSTTGAGGAVNNQNEGTLTITGSTFSGNQANTDGGAICSSGAGDLTIENRTISGNTANNNGGGIEISNNGGTLTFTDLTIGGPGAMDKNTAGGSGGGLCATHDGTLSISGGLIQNNEATVNGGGIFQHERRHDQHRVQRCGRHYYQRQHGRSGRRGPLEQLGWQPHYSRCDH